MAAAAPVATGRFPVVEECGRGTGVRLSERRGHAAVSAPPIADSRVRAVANDFMLFALNAGRYAGFLPNAAAIRLDRGEGHFAYLDECSLPVEAMGVPICADRPGVMRGEVHQRLGAAIVDFFTRELKKSPR